MNNTGLCQDEYTVLAKSGLALRAKPAINSEKLENVKLFDRVELIELHREQRIEVEGIVGFWVEVNYNGLNGFMFSGYLAPRKYRNDNFEQYIFLDECEDEYDAIENGTEGKLNFTLYDPNLRWFGVIIKQNETIIEEVEMNLEVYTSAIQRMYDRLDEPPSNPLKDSVAQLTLVGNDQVYNFFIGSNLDLNGANVSKRHHDGLKNEIPGKFISPYKPIMTLDLNYLQSEIFIDQEKCVGSYELYLLNNMYQIKYDFEYNGSYKRRIRDHLSYQSPRLIWEGDFNNDSLIDFIFYDSPMEDKCGARGYSVVYISNQDEDNIISYRKYYGINLSSMNYGD